MDWTFYDLKKGRIVDANGDEVDWNWPTFQNALSADEYLEQNKIQATIR